MVLPLAGLSLFNAEMDEYQVIKNIWQLVLNLSTIINNFIKMIFMKMLDTKG